MARTTLVALVAAATLVNSGCATMLSGTEQQVTIRTDPPDAEVIIDGVTRGRGSATVDLSRGDLHEVRVEHPDHEPATVALDTEMNPKTWLNMLLLPLFWVGFGVDAATGAIADVVPNVVDVVLPRRPEAPAPHAAREPEAPPKTPPPPPSEQPPAPPVPATTKAEGDQMDWVVAVMDVTAPSEPQPLTPASQRALGDQIRAFMATRRIKVVDRGVQQRALAQIVANEKTRSYAPCVDSECQIPLGKALAATHVLRATVSQFGQTCSTTAELIELRREVAISAAAGRSACDPEAILNASEQVTDELIRRSR